MDRHARLPPIGKSKSYPQASKSNKSILRRQSRDDSYMPSLTPQEEAMSKAKIVFPSPPASRAESVRPPSRVEEPTSPPHKQELALYRPQDMGRGDDLSGALPYMDAPSIPSRMLRLDAVKNIDMEILTHDNTSINLQPSTGREGYEFQAYPDVVSSVKMGDIKALGLKIYQDDGSVLNLVARPENSHFHST